MINKLYKTFHAATTAFMLLSCIAWPIDNVSASGVKIEALPGEPPSEQRRLPAVAVDVRKAAEAHVKAAKATFTRFVVAPDAVKAAVLYRRPTGILYELVIVRSPGGGIEEPVPPGLRVADVSWRPDSRMLAVVTRDPHPVDADRATLYLYNLDERTFRRLFKPAEGFVYSLQWHPSGNSLAFLVSDPFETGDRLHGNLFLIETASGGVKQLTKAPHWVSPVWSPAGRQLAVADERIIGHGDGGLWVQIFDSQGGLLRKVDLRPALAGIATWDSQVLSIRWLSEQALTIRVGAFDGHEVQDVRWFRVSW